MLKKLITLVEIRRGLVMVAFSFLCTLYIETHSIYKIKK